MKSEHLRHNQGRVLQTNSQNLVWKPGHRACSWVSVGDQLGVAGSQHQGHTLCLTLVGVGVGGEITAARAEREGVTGEAGRAKPKCQFWIEDNLGGDLVQLFHPFFLNV